MKNISDNIKAILALMIVFFSFVYFFLVAVYKIGNDQITIAIVGLLGIVVGYYFGSSQSSAKKQDVIDDLNKKIQADDANPPIVGDRPKDRG